MCGVMEGGVVFVMSGGDMSELFFVVSRRRHTRWTGDGSSDVCSSDLDAGGQASAVSLAHSPDAAVSPRQPFQRIRSLHGLAVALPLPQYDAPLHAPRT